MGGTRTASVSDAMNQPQRDHLSAASADASGRPDGQGMNQGLQVLSYLIAGVATYGFLGWLGDHLLDTAFLLPIGIVVGAGLSIYLVIKRFTAEPGVSGSEPLRTTTKTRGRV